MTPARHVLGFCAPFVLIVSLTTDPGLAMDPGTERQIRFKMATEALQMGDQRLAADLLRELVRDATGPESLLYSALLIRAEGRLADSDAALEALIDEVNGTPFAPQWAWSDLLGRVARQRLTARQEAARRGLEAVLARHYEARGGVTALRAVRSMVVHGKLVSRGTEFVFRLARKRPRFYRLDIMTAEGRQIEAADGQVAWSLVTSPSGVEGSHLEGTRADRVLGESFFDDVLLRYRETGERLYLAGTETLETGEAYSIEIDCPGGRHETRFLDAVTFLEVRRVIWGNPGAPPAAVITLAYGAVDEPTLPIRQVVETTDGVTEYLFERYDFAVEIDPYAFDLATVLRRQRGRIEAEAAKSPQTGG